jgi:hypothetical protein
MWNKCKIFLAFRVYGGYVSAQRPYAVYFHRFSADFEQRPIELEHLLDSQDKAPKNNSS